jgi:protein subunit release factor A
MNAVKMNKLDAKLREMFEENKQTETRRSQRKSQTGTGNIIRRRKGEEDKRISL